jgi:O-antigen ligase
MLAIYVILGIAAVVWGVLLAVRGSLLLGCVSYLILASCFGPFFFGFDVAGITLSLDRLYLVALVGAFVVQWRLGRTLATPLLRVDYVLLALVGTIAVSTFAHDWRASSPHDIPIVQHLINGYVIPLALYWIARQAPVDERGMKLLLGVLVAFGAYLGVTGMLELAQQWSLVFPSYIADPDVGTHFGRARGPMVQSVSYGVYLSVCLLGGWLLRERLQQRVWQLAVLAVLPLMVAGIYFSKTRSVWLGLASGLFLVLAVTLRGRTRMAVLGAMVLAGLAFGATKLDSVMSLQREGSVQDTRQSNSMRASFAYVSWQMFLDRPLFGFGFGQFTRAKLPYLGDRSVDLQLEQIRGYVQHSTFLAVLTELGLLGMLLFLALLFGWMRCGWRVLRDERAPPWSRTLALLLLAVMAISFWQMIVHETTFTPLDNSLLFFFAAISVGMCSRSTAARLPAVEQRAPAAIARPAQSAPIASKYRPA